MLQENWKLILGAILLLPIVGSLGFALWLRRRPDLDRDHAIKSWEVFLKFVSALTVTVAGAFAFVKYIDQQERAPASVRADSLSENLKIATTHVEGARSLFGEAKRVAAELATTSPAPPDLVKRFEQLYFGDLIGVEQRRGPVEQAMVRFRRRLHGLPAAPADDLEQLSLQLSAACETELRQLNDELATQRRVMDAVLLGTGRWP